MNVVLLAVVAYVVYQYFTREHMTTGQTVGVVFIVLMLVGMLFWLSSSISMY